MQKEKMVIVAMARTPFGAFQGALSSISAPKLGAIAISSALAKLNLDTLDVDEVIMGNVLTSGVGQAPARQASIYAELDYSVRVTTVNKVCGSGMKSISMAAQSLLLGASSVVVAGGMESMSQVPYFLPGARDGYRLGDKKCVDGMVYDGLINPFDGSHMGVLAERLAKENHLSRERQDEFAIKSFQKAIQAMKEGHLDDDIATVDVKLRRETLLVKEDEGPLKVNFDKIPKLRPVFDKEGSITAANASTINDGACACVLMTEKKSIELGLKPLARIVSMSAHSQDPVWFTTAPIGAAKKALKRASWKEEEVDLWEINEAFAVVALAFQDAFSIPESKLNVWGGAIAIGHPIGASGTRIVMQLIRALKQKNLKRGLAAICIGGGEGMAICLEVEG
jgi:acetyl-CoA C-acetyltransferase